MFINFDHLQQLCFLVSHKGFSQRKNREKEKKLEDYPSRKKFMIFNEAKLVSSCAQLPRQFVEPFNIVKDTDLFAFFTTLNVFCKDVPKAIWSAKMRGSCVSRKQDTLFIS